MARGQPGWSRFSSSNPHPPPALGLFGAIGVGALTVLVVIAIGPTHVRRRRRFTDEA